MWLALAACTAGTSCHTITGQRCMSTLVVDSTKLSEKLGDAAMADLWPAHNRVARDLLPAHHGREIDKTDGFLMLFENAPADVARGAKPWRWTASPSPTPPA